MSFVETATESITFRVNAKILDKLRNESKSHQISLSTLVNQIFTQHVSWHAFAVDAGFITILKCSLADMIKKITDNEIKQIALDSVKNNAKDIVLFLRQEYSVNTVLELIETWAKISGYHYKQTRQDNKISFVIQHDLGKKWSLYLSTIWGHIFENFAQQKIDFDITSNTIAFTIVLQKQTA